MTCCERSGHTTATCRLAVPGGSHCRYSWSRLIRQWATSHKRRELSYTCGSISR
jgi:hypothetical protein